MLEEKEELAVEEAVGVVEVVAEEEQDNHSNPSLKHTTFKPWDHHPLSTMETEPKLTIGLKS